jgi:SAM-dependent methyltransferase
MNRHRYRFALDYCEGKDVLEVACGSGQGLGFLARKARSVVGGDFTQSLVDRASSYYGDRLSVLRFDAQSMPFPDHSFDVVILFEAIYYLPSPEKFLSETRRVLRQGGTVLISSVNPEWTDFNPSPMSTRYFSVPTLATLLRENGFEPEVRGAFRVEPPTAKGAVVSLVKRLAVSANLVPGSMKGKEFLKKLFLRQADPASCRASGGRRRFRFPRTHRFLGKFPSVPDYLRGRPPPWGKGAVMKKKLVLAGLDAIVFLPRLFGFRKMV